MMHVSPEQTEYIAYSVRYLLLLHSVSLVVYRLSFSIRSNVYLIYSKGCEFLSASFCART